MEETTNNGEGPSAFLDRVSAAAVALLAVVGWQFARAAIVNMPAIVLMVFGAVLVIRYEVNSAWLVLGERLLGLYCAGLGLSERTKGQLKVMR